ncbi:MAG: hydroxymethylbilane synthase [Polyangiaceae bacterium]|nr:hydroxymethylbilane synthase [Polyangiaceae bacterium]
MKFTYATRGSALALAQARAFVCQIAASHPGIALVEEKVVTTGDRILDRPLADLGGKGLFIKEIEEALLSARADFAVHSIKDVPGILPPGLVIVCIPVREDVRDVLVAPRHGLLGALPKGARIGTSSLRRAASLRGARPDLEIAPVRGNIDTRLRKVDSGEFDAIILARAGLLRLGLEHRATDVLSPDVSLPAVGQGALGIECRQDNDQVCALLAPLHDELSSRCVAAERGVLVALEGDCKTPIAAYAEKLGGSGEPSHIHLRAFVCNPDGTNMRRAQQTMAWPTSDAEAEAFGSRIGQSLLR